MPYSIWRSVLLIVALAAGALVPGAQVYSGLIQYLIMVMLFFAFLEVELNRDFFSPRVLAILGLNLVVAVAAYWSFRTVGERLGVVAFVVAIAPTATAAPVITSFLRGKVEFVVASVLLTNISIALLIPALLPLVAGGTGGIPIGSVLASVLLVVILPLIAAQAVRRLAPESARRIGQTGSPAFWALLAILFLATSKATHFIVVKAGASRNELTWIGAVTLVLCVTNFLLGAWVGGRSLRQEGSQALGQKNISFTLWLSLTFLDPVVALGPAFYVVFQHLYISFQLIWAERHHYPAKKSPGARANRPFR